MKRATQILPEPEQITIDFNPRPREEGDSTEVTHDMGFGDFNPRPREEGDSFHCLYYNVPLYFNPRPREEGDFL